MHRAAGRFELCHRWLARMQARPELRLDALDADWRAIEALARPVSREIHKMHAFVRFPDHAAAEPARSAHCLVRARAPHRARGTPSSASALPTCTGPSSRRNAARTGTAMRCA
ncbi:NAD(+) hydrolase SARM1 [Manis javanica]|nr:NAD(+) hydrolase SARM1 [Manis javanica]